MLIRYVGTADAGGSPPPPPSGIKFLSSTIISSAIDQNTYTVILTGGPSLGNVTIQCSYYVANNPSFQYFNVFNANFNKPNLLLGQTFNTTLDVSGRLVFTVILNCADIPHASIATKLNIITVSAGSISTPSGVTFIKSIP